MDDIGLRARILGVHLGLGDLNQPEPCMKYQNGCVCTSCTAREQAQHDGEQAAAERVADTTARLPVQPWVPRAPRDRRAA